MQLKFNCISWTHFQRLPRWPRVALVWRYSEPYRPSFLSLFFAPPDDLLEIWPPSPAPTIADSCLRTYQGSAVHSTIDSGPPSPHIQWHSVVLIGWSPCRS